MLVSAARANAPMVLVAALMLVGCAWVNQDEVEGPQRASGPFQILRERELDLPRSRASQPCELEYYATHIRGVPAEAALGRGPVDPVFPGIPRGLDLFPAARDSTFVQSRWRGAEVLVVSEPRYQGPVLLRGGQIDGRHRLGFGHDERPNWELRLPGGQWESTEHLKIWNGRTVRLPAGWRVQPATMRIAASGCYALQLDGESFSQVIEFGATLQRGF
jgi:hypothetical protein